MLGILFKQCAPLESTPSPILPWKRQDHNLPLSFLSSIHLFVPTGSHWCWEGGGEADDKERRLGETDGETQRKDGKEWLQRKGASEGAGAGCWKGGKKKSTHRVFFLSQVLTCEFLINNYFLFSTATAKPDWTRESKRSHGQLQENDVTSPLALCKSGFISIFSMSVY